MSNVALRVEGLGKKYRIGTHQPYNRLSEVMTGLGKSVIDLPRTMLNKSKQVPQVAEGDSNEFWALKDISFEVQEGDVVGIIGRNGAGKSTLLKILSRITEPTEGRFGVRGRISSLLEVGTGFHPELTGRENIYLSGSVLGMTRSEIKNHFDEIVDFSGVEKFLDTPVKRYSSGMQVRLGFAVAAHLKSEILIIDEVLAVGDVEFQKKCMGKMSDVARGGRTILLVSHNLASIQNICTRGILLVKGCLKQIGSIPEITNFYMEQIYPNQHNLNCSDRTGNGSVRIESLKFHGPSHSSHIISGQPASITIELTSLEEQVSKEIRIAISLTDEFGNRLTTLDSDFLGQSIRITKKNTIVVFHIDKLVLLPHTYTIETWVSHSLTVCDHLQQATVIDVQPDTSDTLKRMPIYRKNGYFQLDYSLNHNF
ncbi:ABC transporter ATP-binding protein [uncultured Rubinisphaera sp.]|uniref:ABC transporter ATP-binding protein n=1 Tax=uncultured Rubinisphaera sp. TaxID=1678686 RepID=UPI0030DA6617|tara:strand:- start:3362 stop:4636 length:1275 start_codon:yes stop_codon:yes gene_type:complete